MDLGLLAMKRELLRGLDERDQILKLIDNLISKDKVEKVLEFLEHDSSIESQIDFPLTSAEKCNLLCQQFKKSPLFNTNLYKYTDIISYVRALDEETYKDYTMFYPAESDGFSLLLDFMNKYMKDWTLMEPIIESSTLSQDKKKQYIKFFEDKKEYNPDTLFAIFSEYKDLQDLNLILIKAFETIYKDSFKAKYYEEEILAEMRAYKILYTYFKDEYELWLASFPNFEERYGIILGLSTHEYFEPEYAKIYTVLLSFYCYETVYQNNWSEFLFPYFFNNIEPNNKLGFIKFLNLEVNEGGSPYVEEFCNCLKTYQDRKQVKLLDLNLIQKPVEFVDNNTEHKGWFETLPNEKYVHSDLKTCLQNLYDELCDKGWLDKNTDINLFVYRFSGLIGPQPLDNKINWLGQKGELAYLIQCLYITRNETLPYKLVCSFFSLIITNPSQQADSLKADKKNKITVMLEKCGFTNVNPKIIKK